jgi:hypothetical protein
MLFAQPMNILIGGTTTDHVTGLGVVDASDYNIWRFGFFDPGAMNPSLHPFTLHVGEGPEDDLNVAPLLDLDTAGTTQGIIGILIGLIGPVEGADVALLHAGDEIALTTGTAGVVTIPDLQDGAYDLRVSYTDSRGQAVGLSYQLWVDTTAGTYRIR